jgi:epoxyqueuosine reductase
MVTRSYYHDDPPRRPASGRIAKYARGVDYHEALRAPLDRLASYVESVGGPETLVKWYVDYGPVPERELAQRAGLGWIGKNTMLIDPRRGSYLFLASVLTDADLAVDQPFEPDRCGSCTKCLEACPTGAFPNERVLDSRRCISYLTIEHHGEIDAARHDGIGDWIFGCDICQDVCPWNHKFAVPANGDPETYDPSLADIDLQQLLNMSSEEFARRYAWTALERPGIGGMQRNARIALGNLERKSLWPTSPIP